MHNLRLHLVAVLSAAAMAFAGCSGSDGAPGTNGTNGTNGQNGQNGSSTGTISGTLTYQLAGTSHVASGVTVSVTPATAAPVTSGADGSYSIDVPIGVYSVKFSGTGYEDKTQANVSVVAATTTALDATLTSKVPFSVDTAVSANAAGFGQQVTLGVTVGTGATAPYTYSWAAQSSNPTAVTLSSTTAAAPTFTTGTLAAMAAGAAAAKKAYLQIANRVGFVGISTTEKGAFTYNFDCTVTDAKGYSKKATVAVSTVTLASGTTIVPVGRMVIANYPGNTATVSLSAKPSTSTATVSNATSANPYFTPDAQGVYTITDGTSSLSLTAAEYTGAQKSCETCHGTSVRAAVDAKFDAWVQSAHGNFYFNTQVPSALVGTTVPGALTLFAAGIDGVEGSKYGSGCYGCHTVGYDTTPSANNGGFDEVAKAKGWTQPDLTKIDPTSLIDYTRYATAVPAELQNMAGIQCEMCHGPLGQHKAMGGTPQPKAEYSAEACNICHDAATHHDKGWLWKQGGHSNHQLAIDEHSNHCVRCHTAQGFVNWVSTVVNNAAYPNDLATPVGTGTGQYPLPTVSAAEAEPQTCQACHDPHLTQLRLSGYKSDGSAQTLHLPAGFTVTGLGAGTTCVACHNSRNGAHNDSTTLASYSASHVAAQADVFFGQNAYFVSGVNISKHSAVADTCVGCHVNLRKADGTVQGPTIPSVIPLANTNHTFRIDKAACGVCHGNTDGEALQAGIEAQLESLGSMIAPKFLPKLSAADFMVKTGNLYAYDAANDTYGAASDADVTIPASNAITSVSLFEVHGGMGLKIKLTTAIQVASGVTTDTVLASVGNMLQTDGTTKVFEIDSTKANFAQANVTLLKTTWNYFLLEHDGTKGVHNPSFYIKVIDATAATVANL